MQDKKHVLATGALPHFLPNIQCALLQRMQRAHHGKPKHSIETCPKLWSSKQLIFFKCPSPSTTSIFPDVFSPARKATKGSFVWCHHMLCTMPASYIVGLFNVVGCREVVIRGIYLHYTSAQELLPVMSAEKKKTVLC